MSPANDSPAGLLVGILMGSDSDWPKINKVADALNEFEIEFEVNVMSAHRTPQAVAQYANAAADRGIKVLICAAGGAAHLAGVVAAHTTLPVLGLPVATDVMGGIDSLLSTVQMPGDIPVATFAVGSGGARNAGLFAVHILALSDPQLAKRLRQFRESLAAKIQKKNQALRAQLSS